MDVMPWSGTHWLNSFNSWYDFWITQFEVRETVPTSRELAPQPMKVLVFASTHPFVRFRDHCVVKPMRDYIALYLARLPVMSSSA